MYISAEMINAIAALLWPIFSLITVVLFKKEISYLIGRIKKGTFLGQEIELTESLQELKQSASLLSEEVAALPSHQKNQDQEREIEESEENTIKNIIQKASRSPKAALLLLATEIEKEARQTMACIGLLNGRKSISLVQAINELDEHYGLPRHVSSSLKLFWETRSRIIHGGHEDEGNIFSAIDSGASILQSLQSLPRESNWVYHPGVEIFSDSECKVKIDNAKGIILKSQSPSGAKTFYRIFPTTRKNYIKGNKVSWEWSFKNRWSSAWYKDPDSGEVKPAWSSSAEFTGRHLDEV